MKKIILFSLVVVITVGFFSCKCVVNGCDDINYRCTLWFENYRFNSVNPMLLISYEKGSNFTVYKDSAYFTSAYSSNIGPTYQVIFEDSIDYIISLPMVGLEYRLTDMQFSSEMCRGGCGKTPITQLKNCRINGVQRNTDLGIKF